MAGRNAVTSAGAPSFALFCGGRRYHPPVADESLLFDPQAPPAITGFDPDRRDPQLLGIKSGRRTLATVPAIDIGALNLRVGDPWSEAAAVRVRGALEKHRAHRHALRLLELRAYSTGELVERLISKGFADPAAAEAVARLTAAGVVDDETLARDVAESAVALGGATPALIEHKLHRRRIDPGLARRIAGESLAGTDPVEVAADYAASRLRRAGSLDPAVARRRVASALSRRGYDHDVITSVLARFGLVGDDAAGETP